MTSSFGRRAIGPLSGADARSSEVNVPNSRRLTLSDPRAFSTVARQSVGGGSKQLWPVLFIVLLNGIAAVDLVGAGPLVVSVATLVALMLIVRLSLAIDVDIVVAIAGIFFTFCALQYFFNPSAGEARKYDVVLLVVMLPLVFALGTLVSGHYSTVVQMLRAVVVVAIVAAVLGIAEAVSHHYVVNNPLFFGTEARGSFLRARSIYPQPLVLATVLLVGLVFAVNSALVPRKANRILGGCILSVGVLSTQSRGAVGVVVSMVVVYGLCRIIKRNDLLRFLTLCVANVGIVLGVLYSSGLRFGGEASAQLVTSSNAETASAQYRGELYRRLHDILSLRPFGTGFGSVPRNIVVFDSSYGRLDIARSIDSEYVLLAVKFGYVALLGSVVLFIGLLWLISSSSGLNQSVAFSLYAIALSGLFLAIESWVTLVAFVALLSGILCGLVAIAHHSSINRAAFVV